MPVIQVDIKPTQSYFDAVESFTGAEEVPAPFVNDGRFNACPVYSTEGAACCDLYTMTDMTIQPGCSAKAPSGFAVAIPRGYEMVIRPRSGLWFKHVLASFAGTIDCDYRDEVMLSVHNYGTQVAFIPAGERVCQASFKEVIQAEFNCVEELAPADYSSRAGGFGSTSGDNVRRFMSVLDETVVNNNDSNNVQIKLPFGG